MTRINRKKQKQGGRAYAALFVVVVVVLAVGGYLLFSPNPDKTAPSTRKPSVPVPQTPDVHPAAPVIPKAEVNPVYPVEKPVTAKPSPAPIVTDGGTGKLAIIIDDMGTSLKEARSLVAIGVPMTFSIIPGLAKYRDVASFATSSGIETMIHIPMQSKGWPERRLEANGLLISMADADIRERLEGFYRELPRSAGANN